MDYLVLSAVFYCLGIVVWKAFLNIFVIDLMKNGHVSACRLLAWHGTCVRCSVLKYKDLYRECIDYCSKTDVNVLQINVINVTNIRCKQI